jgi:hypothetical protein
MCKVSGNTDKNNELNRYEDRQRNNGASLIINHTQFIPTIPTTGAPSWALGKTEEREGKLLLVAQEYPNPNQTSSQIVGGLARDVDVSATLLAQWEKENELVEKLAEPNSGCFGLNTSKIKKLFENHVNTWAQNGAPGEKRTEAASRIITAYQNENDALFLDLDGLKLGSLPPVMHWTQIKNWRLSNNQLHTLPSSLFLNCPINKPYGEMDLRNNALKELPETFRWYDLSRLDVGYNHLKTLPESTIYIKWIDADFNQINSVRPSYQGYGLVQQNSASATSMTTKKLPLGHPLWAEDARKFDAADTQGSYHLNLIGNELSQETLENLRAKNIPELLIDE